MAPEEVASTREAIDNAYALSWHGSCAFWTDDNSNYAALYLSGPLVGKVCYLDHEEPDLSPVYRSLGSFLGELRSATITRTNWYDMPTDYFVPINYYLHGGGNPLPSTDADMNDDRAVADILRSQLKELWAADSDEHRFLCFAIMGLTPPPAMGSIVEFLHDEDMWIEARAADALGIHKYSGAVDLLADLALRGAGNGVISAINALGRIGTSDCLDALLKCIAVRAQGYAPYLGAALRGCGCEATHDRGSWRYRPPGESQWHAISQRAN